jgi:predicted amidohydrolase
MKLKIAVVQFEIRQFAAEDNLKKAEQFIKEAAPEAQIIVFPEDFITGPLSEEVDTAILNDAEAAYQLRRT